MPERGGAGHELVCLLSVRNGEHDLPGYLESVSHFADAVVALDDGSTDATSEILRRHPLVKVHLSNPRRADDAGGHESGNRNRLLVAAAPLRPRWIVSLDAGERVSADDARALRQFVRVEAVPGAAYGFRLRGAGEPCDALSDDEPWTVRLFAYRNGQRFPRAAPPFVVVPTDVPREHWTKTTLSIHRSDVTVETDRPFALAVVRARGDEQPPASRAEVRRCFDQPLDPRRPVLSVIVISQDDRDGIAEVMDALVSQEVDQPFELILVNSGRDGTAELVRDAYPQVRVVHLSEPALPGAARNSGLRIASGDFVTFPGSHIVLPPGSLQKRIDAHEQGYAMVCGAVLNGTDTRAGWASYFLDHAVALAGRPSRVLRVPPSRCSYMRGPLMATGGFPEDRRVGEDTVVNTRLFELGYRAYYSSEVRCVHKTPCTTVARLLRHHFERGVGFGRILWEQAGEPQGFRPRGATMLWLMTRYPVRRVRFITEAVHDWGATVRRQFFLSFPLVLAGVASAAVGAILFLAGLRNAGARASIPVSQRRTSEP